ncbi:hypothetical protein [Algoriphagus jejuensis]|uniref:hypothetical protein n=1 Tax=Algoriphagus jejuensis TaxID=419934 RepID=UPI0031D0F85E
MSKMLVRLILSFCALLAIGSSQLFFSISDLAVDSAHITCSTDQLDQERGFSTEFSSPVFRNDHKSHGIVFDWASAAMEKEQEERAESDPWEIRLTLAFVFFFLLSESFRNYHIRFLRFCQNFYFIFPHRLHLYNRVFTI